MFTPLSMVLLCGALSLTHVCMLPLAYLGTDFAPGEQLDALFERSFGDLQFLVDEFSKLEVVIAPESEIGEQKACRVVVDPATHALDFMFEHKNPPTSDSFFRFFLWFARELRQCTACTPHGRVREIRSVFALAFSLQLSPCLVEILGTRVGDPQVLPFRCSPTWSLI